MTAAEETLTEVWVDASISKIDRDKETRHAIGIAFNYDTVKRNGEIVARAEKCLKAIVFADQKYGDLLTFAGETMGIISALNALPENSRVHVNTDRQELAAWISGWDSARALVDYKSKRGTNRKIVFATLLNGLNKALQRHEQVTAAHKMDNFEPRLRQAHKAANAARTGEDEHMLVDLRAMIPPNFDVVLGNPAFNPSLKHQRRP